MTTKERHGNILVYAVISMIVFLISLIGSSFGGILTLTTGEDSTLIIGLFWIPNIIFIPFAFWQNAVALSDAKYEEVKPAVKWLTLSLVFFPISFIFSTIAWKRLREADKAEKIEMENKDTNDDKKTDLSNSI
ncbi:hypothetical protein [Mycoplasma phocoeninasale]|uniref:hypothetical protein n=1 Tax=Mycoplasma phocoeninasale TaxID=2726117 RepID=UPI00196861CA|nr:hypothetical protein [Mycoplasma phocoeninasale]MBN0970575.1 hypothetical protein [Mycoplasma phocoeninasale]